MSESGPRIGTSSGLILSGTGAAPYGAPCSVAERAQRSLGPQPAHVRLETRGEIVPSGSAATVTGLPTTNCFAGLLYALLQRNRGHRGSAILTPGTRALLPASIPL